MQIIISLVINARLVGEDGNGGNLKVEGQRVLEQVNNPDLNPDI